MELSCKFIYFNSPSSDITETNMANAISDARSYDRYSPSPPPLDSPVSDIPSEECLTTPMEEIERHLQSAPNKPNGESIVTPMSETEAPVQSLVDDELLLDHASVNNLYGSSVDTLASRIFDLNEESDYYSFLSSDDEDEKSIIGNLCVTKGCNKFFEDRGMYCDQHRCIHWVKAGMYHEQPCRAPALRGNHRRGSRCAAHLFSDGVYQATRAWPTLEPRALRNTVKVKALPTTTTIAYTALPEYRRRRSPPTDSLPDLPRTTHLPLKEQIAALPDLPDRVSTYPEEVISSVPMTARMIQDYPAFAHLFAAGKGWKVVNVSERTKTVKRVRFQELQPRDVICYIPM